jgi:molybdopterin-containing oxidoreductase family iron-sulfur binding subunit
MEENRKQYWKGLEQLKKDPEFIKYAEREFPRELPVVKDESAVPSGSRRDFLKMMGFSVAAASIAACEAPVRKAIPYLNKPVNIEPGVPNYYASTYTLGGDYCSIVVKTREGRPIKIQGNNLSKISQGGTNAQVEASILSLYDKERLTGPLANGEKSELEVVDTEIIEQLKLMAQQNGQIRIVSHTVLSPTTQDLIDAFTEKYPSARHITYETDSMHGMREANRTNFGVSVIPSFNFAKADVIVSFDADFLGNWLNSIGFSKDYARNRKINRDHRKMSRHYHYESLMSLTGSNADYRIPIKPSQEGVAIATLYNLLAQKADQNRLNVTEAGDVKFLTKAADNLWAARERSLVVADSNDPDIQMLVNGINKMLDNYGSTIDLSRPYNLKKGNDQDMNDFIAELENRKVDGVIFFNVNPVYNHPKGSAIAEALQNVPLSISTSEIKDETASLTKYVVPDHHYLESWDDAEPLPGQLSLVQPAITPLFNTRQIQESLLTWMEAEETDYFEYLKSTWGEKYFTTQEKIGDFQMFWDQCLHDGIYTYAPSDSPSINGFTMPEDIEEKINNKYFPASDELELILYTKIGVGDGTQANNPWLQEMPDPITKATWDNYLTIPQSLAGDLGIGPDGNKFPVANLTANGKTLKVPVLVQPGQAKKTLGLALGYGRRNAGRVANGLGIDAYPLMDESKGFWSKTISGGVTVEPLPEVYRIAQTQTHHTYMGRTNVIQEAYLEEYQADPRAGRVIPKIATSQDYDRKVGDGQVDGKVDATRITLWKGHDYNNHHWGLLVDLNSCIGCSACTISCQVENNVPVVGKEEVLNRRDMHWIRIDRYYSSDAPLTDMVGLDQAAENPEITYQPMMCQHCNNAPCETVCPVAATTHSTEGLNQMAYNRCIGTRYCANNCPYKVRRFNWFKYHDNDQFSKNTAMHNDLGKMVLNPDVTVRSRGVMEKCSFCIQRIQYGKLQAKLEGRRTLDGDVNVACAESCPSEALVFGDLNDPNSRIRKMMRVKDHDGDKFVQEERVYTALEEIGVRPNVFYTTKIRNKNLEDKNA